MHGKHRQVITGWQLFCLMTNAIVATGVFTLARDVGEAAGAGALLSIPLAGLVMTLQLLGMFLLARRFPGQTLNEYSGQILGTGLARIYLLVYAFLSLGVAISVPRGHWPLVSAWTLNRTPQLAYLGLLALVCWNIVKRGAVVAARVVELLSYDGLAIMLLLMLPILEIDLDYVRPVFEHGVAGIVQGIVPSFYALAGFDIFLIAYPYVRSQRQFLIGVAGIATATLFYTVTTFYIIGNLGLRFTLLSTWPLQLYLGKFGLTIFERVDIVFLIMWSFQIIGSTTVVLYIAATCLQGAFPQLSSRVIAATILILALAAAAYPVDFVAEEQVMELFNSVGIAYFGLMPWVLWLVAVLRGKGGRHLSEQGEKKKAA